MTLFHNWPFQAEREKKAAELKTCFEYIEELEER